MRLMWPWMLLFAVLPLALLLFAWRQRRPERAVLPKVRRGRLVGGSVQFGAGNGVTSLPWRYLVVFALAVLALARPQWGRDTQPTFEGARELLVALDLSRSMLARDLAPSRLERARSLAAALAQDLPTARLGLLGFAGRAYVLVPPSDDRTPFNAYITGVAPEHMLEQGSDLGALLAVARDAFTPQAATRTLVVLSDGEAQSDAWRAQLPELERRGVRVIAVGLGTSAGTSVPALDGSSMRDGNGAVVRSRLQPEILSTIAAATRGVYLDAPGAGALIAAAQAGLDATASGVAGKPEERLVDRYELFVIAALLLLCWSAVSEWTAAIRLAPPPRRQPLQRMPFAAGLVGVAALLLGGGMSPARSAVDPASVYVIESEDVPVSEDPLAPLVAEIDRVARLPAPLATDWLAIAQATTRYGDEQYTRAPPTLGILRDGLAAVERGRSLDPARSEWQPLHDALQRLVQLVLSPPQTEGEQDPANDIGAGPGAAQQLAQDDKTSKESEPKDREAQKSELQNAEKSDKHPVGGSQRALFDPNEWQLASLVVPLELMESLRVQTSPAEWFRVAQQHAPASPASGAQQW